MPETPAPAPEQTTQTTPAPDTATAGPVATPDASPPSSADSSTPAEPTASPADKPLDVHAELMKVATAAVSKPAQGDPSAPSSNQGNGKVPEASPTAKEPKAPAAPTNGAAAAAQDEEDDFEAKPPPFHHDPRWQRVTAKLKEASEQRDALRAPAEQYGKIMDYMTQFQLTTDDMVVAYDIIARIKHDPISAYERLKPIMDDLAKRAGHVLPDDLQKKIDEGYIDEESARELAQERVRKKLAEDRATRATVQTGQAVQQQVIERNRVAASSWEAERIAKDPDFERKRLMVQDAARAIIAQEGQPRSPEAAVGILDRAYKRVNDALGGYQPKPSATPRQPSSASNSSSAVAPKPPGSLLEAAKQGLAGTYRYGQPQGT